MSKKPMYYCKEEKEMNYNETHSSVGIFMDAENVIKAFRETTDGIDGAYIDFGEMRNLLAGDRDIRCSKAYLIVVLICISLIMSDVEHLFMGRFNMLQSS